ncbi:MAG TPA: 16S rRNA (adenine(1518)-N(6)/adenine(1519)-N(6))-dimethyltransferase, partial [Clostridiales bacterium]|nr:16S rRNA (adenine(1518)-N(6)/adenine(1519)-N(6))-dimethyltransferase [Clostridiales bacterium]
MNNDFRKKKQYGQNFLVNNTIPKRIAEQSGITENSGVLEIGPGFGVLTRELARISKKVVSVEIDRELIPILSEKLSGLTNVKVINEDILRIDIAELVATEFSDLPVYVCANLPYYITTPIIMKLLEGRYGFVSITLMVQKEVAERLCAKSGEPAYGAITAPVNYYAKVTRLFTVKAGSFSPAPKVDSAVIKLDLYKEPPVYAENEELLFTVIKSAFSQRRKTLVNSLHSVFNSIFTKDEICDIMIQIGLNSLIRGEDLDISQFADISNRILKKL